jgi:DNA-binding MarR family transcriptional regulator
MVELTAAGRKLTNRLVELHTKLENDMIAHLGASERDQLLELLRKFLRLDPEPDLDPD